MVETYAPEVQAEIDKQLIAAKVAEIQKADPNKSKVAATAEAMRDPEIQKAWAEAAK